LEQPHQAGFKEGDLEISKPKDIEISVVFVIRNSIKLQKMILEGKINLVTHLGQWHVS
jgi:hypothetical protein